MKCRKCGSTNVSANTSVMMKSKRRSFLWNLLWILCTGGLWLIWMLVRAKKEKQVKVTTCTCQQCGYSWRIS